MIKLMIKTHNKTGLNYLCVTTKVDHVNYSGSGVKWIRHLKFHGFDIHTVLLYTSQYRDDNFKAVCLYMSDVYDVVNSAQWANLINEDGNSGSAYTNRTSEHREDISTRFKEKFKDPVIGPAWRFNISEGSKRVWASHTPEEVALRINKIKDAYTPEKRAIHSATLKEAYANMSAERKKDMGKILSDKYKSQTDEWKEERGNKISESLQTSAAAAEFRLQMKTERLGGGNPAARVVHWDGMVFNTCGDFYQYIRENKCISKNAAENILKKNPTPDRHIASKKTGEMLYAK